MAWADVIKRRGLLAEKPKKPKKQSSSRGWSIESERKKIADRLKKWVDNDLSEEGWKGKPFTSIGESETKISVHYLTTLIGGKSLYFATTDRDEVKKCCLELADDIASGEADEEIKRISVASNDKKKAKTSKLAG